MMRTGSRRQRCMLCFVVAFGIYFVISIVLSLHITKNTLTKIVQGIDDTAYGSTAESVDDTDHWDRVSGSQNLICTYAITHDKSKVFQQLSRIASREGLALSRVIGISPSQKEAWRRVECLGKKSRSILIWLSTLKTWRRALERCPRSADWVLVFEDDAVPPPRLLSNIDRVIHEV